MGDLDLASLVTADDSTAQERAAALAAALRGQQLWGMAGQATGDQAIAKAGGSLAEDARHRQDFLNALPMTRAKLAADKEDTALTHEKAASAQREAAAEQSPEYGSFARRMLANLGTEAPESASPQALALMLPSALKVAGVGKYAVNPVTGGVYNVHTGDQKVGSAPTSALSGPALDQAAEMFHTTGQLPSVGMGAAGALVRRQIINRAAELHPDANLAANKAGFKADEGSLAKLQAQADAVNGFEQTARGNLQNFLNLAGGVPDSGIPFLNKPLRSLDNKMLGSPDMAAFAAARQVAINEIAKVLNNPGAGGAAVSDSARHEIESLVGADATLAQIKRAAEVLLKDMETRKGAIASQLAEIRGRIGGQKPAAAEGAPAAPAIPEAAPHPKDSAAVEWAKAHPKDPRAAQILKANGL